MTNTASKRRRMRDLPLSYEPVTVQRVRASLREAGLPASTSWTGTWAGEPEGFSTGYTVEVLSEMSFSGGGPRGTFLVRWRYAASWRALHPDPEMQAGAHARQVAKIAAAFALARVGTFLVEDPQSPGAPPCLLVGAASPAAFGLIEKKEGKP